MPPVLPPMMELMMARATMSGSPGFEIEVWKDRSTLGLLTFNGYMKVNTKRWTPDHQKAQQGFNHFSFWYFLLLNSLQCDKVLAFLGNKFYYWCGQNVWWLFGQWWKTLLFKSNWRGYILGNFWKNLGYFLFQHLVTLVLSNVRHTEIPSQA